MRVLLMTFLLVLPISGFKLKDQFSANLTWAHSLDSPSKLRQFINSSHYFARESVTLYHNTPVMGLRNSTFRLFDCLAMFFAANPAKFLLLHVVDRIVLLKVRDILDQCNSPRIGVLVKIQRGPNVCLPEINPYSVLNHMTSWPRNVRVVFGFYTADGPIHEYTKREMRELEEAMKSCNKILKQRFVIEFDAFYITRRFTLFTDVEFVRQQRFLVLIRAPIMSFAIDKDILTRLVCFFDPKNVFLDIPQELRDKLDLSCTKSGSSPRGRSYLMAFYTSLMMTLFNARHSIILQ